MALAIVVALLATACNSMRMGRARAVIALLVLISVAGCASVTPVQSPAASDSTSPAWPSDTSYGRLFSQVQPDGSVSRDVALQAFSTAIAPLPGVPVAPGSPPNDYEQADGSFAIEWLTPYMDQLTPEQKSVVDQALAPSTGSPVAPVRAVADVNGGLGPLVAADDPAKPYKDAISSAESIIVSRLHRNLQEPIFFGFSGTPTDLPNALAYAFSAVAANGIPTCEVRATEHLAGSSQTRINVTMAHEVFHCFQFDLLRAQPDAKPLSWILEGQAEWVGEDVAGPGPEGTAWWTVYLISPQVPLFQRTYDAVGFYEHLAETGTSPWSIFDAMLATPSDSEAAFKATGAQSDDFLDTWASGMSRIDTLPPAWYAQARWHTDAMAPEPYDEVANGSLFHPGVPEVANEDLIIDTTADVTELYFLGHVRMDTSGVDTPEITTVDLCLNNGPNACKCPDGATYNGPPLTPTDGRVHLALTGGLVGADGTIRGRPWSDFCGNQSPPGNPVPRGGADPCANGCAGSVGDPHLQTVDQPDEFYEFQGAGEYTLLRSTDGSMEMQGRQVPYSGDIPNVSINTALAWKVAGHRVAMYANHGSDTYSLTLDGSALDPASIGTTDLGSGAALTVMADGIEVAYGDGTIATAFFHGNGFADALDLNVAPSDTFRSQAVGLLGHLAAGSELPALPDGTILPVSQDPATRYAQRYKQLGPAWLVTDQTTLFDYQPGETTATFYKPDYPSQDAPIDPDLDALELLQGADTFEQATGQCAGVQGDPSAYLDCVFDTLLTGDGEFAQFYTILEEFFAAGPTVLETPQVQATPTPAPSFSSSLPAGLALVASGISLIDGATVGPDGTVYASLSDATDYSPLLVSVNTSTGQPGASVKPSGAGRLFLLDGSLWMAEDDPTGSGNCLLERFDPQTLASQAKIPIGCDIGGPTATPVTDGVWWLDRSTEDANANGGTLRHIDPATNTVDRSVSLPFVNGYLSSSPSTVIYGDSVVGHGWYKLTQGATDLTPVPVPDQTLEVFAAGNGLWYQPESESVGLIDEADFATGSSSPDKTIQIDGYLESADELAVYATSGAGSPETLMRYPTDGSAPAVIMSGTTLTTATRSGDLGFFDNNPPVIANQKIAKLWLASDYPVDGTTSVVAEVASVP